MVNFFSATGIGSEAASLILRNQRSARNLGLTPLGPRGTRELASHQRQETAKIEQVSISTVE